ncbi:MAG: LysM peptidoglycan-binding domain-containing M23 family metallopeptidase [Patescibacteria group bacterium]
MSFEFISNPTAKYNNLEFGKNLLKTSTKASGYLYQPNFILIDSNSVSRAVSLFGDILPIYLSSKELTNVIVTSWEGLTNLVVLSRTFLVCLLSFLNTVIHNTVYQAYTAIVSAYGQVLLLPERYSGIQNKLANLIRVFSTSQGRELWWLEVRLDIKSLVKKALRLMSLVLEVSKKFYLAWVVFFVIGFLNYSAAFSNLSNTPNSFLSKFIDNYSLSSNLPLIDGNTKVTALATPYVSSDVPQIQAITKYQVQDGDSLQQVAYRFGLNPETIKLNNDVKEELEVGQKIYIPWVDGYIFNAQDDTTVQKLEKIYSVPAEKIKEQNISIFNTETSGFNKEALVLIPTSDFAKIDQGNKLLESQKQAIARSRRNKNLAARSITYKAPSESLPSSGNKTVRSGFIWPTTGSISRCFSRIHRGCDIANFSAPPVKSVQKGVVRVGYEAGGYGNFVRVDHGNGLVTIYAHLSHVYVSTGQLVGQGEQIGKMGRTGYSTGIHLHFEVQVNGVRVDPLGYLPAR